MKILSLVLLLCAPLAAQNLTFFVDNSNGSTPSAQLQQLPATYPFPDTPVGSVSKVVIRVVNTSASAVTLNAVFVGNSPSSLVANPNYTVTGLAAPSVIAPQNWKLFTINFTPSTTGTLNGYLQANTGSSFSVATLTGAGTPAQITLSCTSTFASQCTGGPLQPSATAPINFGNVLTTASSTIQFTLANGGSTAINPQTLVSIQTAINNPNSAFSLGSMPASLAAGASVTFTVTFAPGTTATSQTSLLVGSASYLIQGTGLASVIGDISSLVITYVDPTGVRLIAQAATSINFGQIVAGANISSAFTFTVSNPDITIGPVTVPAVSITGAGYTLSNAPAFPAAIQPGASLSFSVAFNAAATGTYAGTLSIGSRQFTLTGQTIAPLISAPTFSIDQANLTSQQQVHLSVQPGSPSAVTALGTLTMSFSPSLAGVTDDPAVGFVATSGRQLNVSVAAGSQNVAYSGQNAITFQTGTTAGSITFTLQFPNTPTYSKTFNILPVATAVTNARAVRQSPSLVVTLTGYDNTYSTSALAFTFYDTSGQLMTTTPISVNTASAFHDYFFSSSNKVGGAFSLQANFPVTGDVSKVGSVNVTLSNSAGQSSTTQTFQ